jgi:hypothetical protein
MRSIARIAVIPALAACSYNARFQANCNQIFTDVCTHQVECRLTPDHYECDKRMRDVWFCDESRSLDDLHACQDAARTEECSVSIPIACFDVLCDRDLGCLDTVEGDQCREFGTCPSTATETGATTTETGTP